MAQVIPIHRTRFPAAYAFLERELPNFPDRHPAAWSHFKACARLDESAAREAVSLNGTAPVVFASPLGESTWGLFDPDAPGRISLSTAVLSRFAPDAAVPQAQDFLVAKVLHELCHWGCFRQGVADDDQAGEQFEIGAFGGELRPWWDTGGLAPMAPSLAPAAAGDVFGDPDARAAACRALLLQSGQLPGRQADPLGQVFGGVDVSEPLPRGYRNNNPGNLRSTSVAWRGLAEMGERTPFQRLEHSFCVFREPEWGLRAMIVLLRTYKREHGLVTPRDIIGRYAPASDHNDVNSYSLALAKALGVDRDSTVDADDDATVVAMVKAMARHENGMKAPYAELQFQAALRLL